MLNQYQYILIYLHIFNFCNWCSRNVSTLLEASCQKYENFKQFQSSVSVNILAALICQKSSLLNMRIGNYKVKKCLLFHFLQ
jgi:hypothetical protein